jgi:hypothetical protein
MSAPELNPRLDPKPDALDSPDSPEDNEPDTVGTPEGDNEDAPDAPLKRVPDGMQKPPAIDTNKL